jgi:hypothetical protein
MTTGRGSKDRSEGNTYKYYQYKGKIYLIEFNSGGTPVDGAAFQNKSYWVRIAFDLEIIIKNGTFISEREAIRLCKLA